MTRLDGARTLLTAVFHHAVSDQQSAATFLAQVASFYGDSQAELPSDGFPRYAAVANAREQREGSVHLNWWREVLGDAFAGQLLPFDTDAEPARTRTTAATLPADVTQGLREFSRANRVTMSAITVTSVAVALSRWLTVPDVVIGVASAADRALPEAANAIGFFVDTVPVRMDLRDTPTVAGAIRCGADMLSLAATRNAAPFDAVARQLQARGQDGEQGIFQVWCNDLSQQAPIADFAGMAAREVSPASRPALFDLNVYIDATDPALALSLTYAADRYPGAVAEALLQQVTDVLAAVVRSPAQRVDDITASAAAGRPEGSRAADGATVRRTALVSCPDSAGSEAAPAVTRKRGRAVTFGDLDDTRRALAERMEPGKAVAIRARRHPYLAPPPRRPGTSRPPC